MGYDVFVSYSHADAGGWVRSWLVPNLTRHHLSVAIDEDFARGSEIASAIDQAVEQSRVSVLVFTPLYLQRKWTADERSSITLERIFRDIRAIPLLLESCELPKRFRGLIPADFTRDRENEEELEKLVASILAESSQHLLPREAPSPYRNFDVELDLVEGDLFGMTAGCRKINAVTSATVSIPVAEMHGELARIRGGTADRITCQSIGRRLHDAIFPQEVLDLWNYTAETAGSGVVRLRLHIRDRVAARLPWELLFRNDFHLAMVPSYPVVRATRRRAGRPPVARAPSILVVNTIARDGGVSAALESHLRALRDAGTAGDVLSVPAHSREDVRVALRDLPAPYDVVHLFVEPARRDGDGICLRSPNEEPQFLEATELANLLHGSSARLVVVSAAAGGAVGDEAALFTIAERVAPVVTALVAVPGTVAPSAAAAFAQAFYRKLAHGCPVEACMAEGRMAVMTAVRTNNAQWAMPLLFNNDPDALCFGGDPPRECFGTIASEASRSHSETAAEGRPRTNVGVELHQNLVGRDEAMRQAWSALGANDAGPVVLLKGPPGFGKTAVARELAWQAAHGPAPAKKFASVTWVSSSDPQAIHQNDVLRRAAQQVTADGLAIAVTTVFNQRQLLKIEPAARLREIRALFGRGSHLVVIDDVALLAQETVRRFILAMPRQVRFIVTSQRDLNLDETAIEIGRLAPADAHALAAKIARSIGRPLPPGTPTFGGNPFILEVETRRGRYDLDLGDRADITTAEYIQVLFPHLGGDHRRVLAVCTTLPFPAHASVVRTASKLSERAFADVAAHLLEIGLITSKRDQLALCSTLRALFRDGDDTPQRMLPNVTRDCIAAAMHFLDETSRAAGRHDSDEFMEKVRPELENLIWSVQTAFGLGLYGHLKGFREYLEHTLYRLGFWKVALELGDLFFIAAGRTGDLHELGWSALYPLARILFHSGNVREAERCAAAALGIFEGCRDIKGELSARRYIGRVLQSEGRLGEARAVFEHVLEQTRLHLRSRDVASALESIASLEQAAGNLVRAELLYQAAIAEYRKDGEPDPDSITPALHELGRLALLRRQPDEALRHFEDALQRLGSGKWKNRYARITHSIGLVHEQRGDLETAIEKFQVARGIFADLRAKAELAATDAALVRVGAQQMQQRG